MPQRFVFLALSLFAQVLLILPKVPSANGATGLIPHLDKLVHYGIFALTTWAILRFKNQPGTPSQLLIVLALLLWAGATEVIQGLYSTRSTDPWDLLADAIGIIAGYLLFRLELRFTPKANS